MPGVGALVTLVIGVFALQGIARLVASRAAARPATPPEPAATLRLAAAAAIGFVLGVAAPTLSQPMYFTAAAVSAIGTAAAIGIAVTIRSAYAEPAYAVPSLRPRPAETPGALSAEAAAAAAAAAGLTAALAFGLRLIGPSDGGLVFLASFIGMLAERSIDGAWRPTGAARVVPAILGGLVGALAGGGAVLLLP